MTIVANAATALYRAFHIFKKEKNYMKKHLSLVIIFVILSININGQSLEFFWFTNTPCDENYERDTMFVVSYNELKEIYSNLKRELNLFENYDFENENYQIIYAKHEKDTSFYFHISDKKELLQLKKSSYLNKPIFDNSEPCILNGYAVDLILNNEQIETYSVNWECGYLDTKCGKFQFDPNTFLKIGEQCFYKHKTITSKKEYDKYIKELNQDSSLIHYSAHDYFEGFFQFEYIDTSYQILNALRDENKVNDLIQKELERSHPNEFIVKEEIEKKGKEEVAKRLILEEILGWDYRTIEEVKNSPSEKPTYIVSVRYYDLPESKLKKDEVKNLISSWEKTKYSVSSFWKIKK